MNTYKLLFPVLLLLFSLSGKSQKIVSVAHADIIRLEADTYRGHIQWQYSADQANWTDIENGESSTFEIPVTQFPSFYRAKIEEEGCENPHYSQIIEIINSEDMNYWSDPQTWGGSKPIAGEDVAIDGYVILDEDTPELGEITINGVLAFDRKDLGLTAERINVNGTLQIGTVLKPFEQKAIVTLNGTNDSNDGNDRGIMVMPGGSLELHGATPEVLWTKISQHLELNATSLTLEESVEWESGGEIVMAPTDYYEAGNGAAITQKVTLTNVDNEKLTIAEGSNSHRWGLLQYATPNGMSLDETAERAEPPVPNTTTTSTPTVLDERAEIGYLTRNIVIQSPEDDLWDSFGFGCHIMLMPNSQGHVDGVEIQRGGQRGHIRRYPFHWHNLSYQTPQTLEDAVGQYFKNSVINESSQRGIVIHGTNGVLVDNNIVYKVNSHAIFTEDAVERRNIINHNLVLHVRNPPWNTQLKNHEQGGLHDGGSSAFWISNPDNVITNNAAADCIAFGYWLAFTTQAWGDNIGVLHEDGFLLRPNRLRFGVFENNTAHSVKLRGIILDLIEVDNEGNVNGAQYYSTADGRDPSWPFEHLERFTLSGCTLYKCGHNGFWDRSTWPNTVEFVSADNCGRFFAGAGAEGQIERNLVVGTSLNTRMNGTGREVLGWTDFYRLPDGQTHEGSTPVAFASYHHTFVARDNIVVNFPLVDGERSGAFAMDDYYIRGIEKGQVRNTNNLLIESHPGFKTTAPDPWYTFSSAVWDPHGVWGTEGNYLVQDHPFITYEKDTSPIGSSSQASGAVSVSGPFYSFRGFILYGKGDTPPQNQHYLDLWNIHVSRLDNELTEVATWFVDAAGPADLFSHMKDFITTPDAIYQLTFPDLDPPTDFAMLVDNMLETTDTQVIAVQFDGSLTNLSVGMEAYGNRENYQAVSSLVDVRSSEGATYWQDTENSLIWTKLRGGIWEFWTDNPTEAVPSFEDTTYEQLVFFVRPAD
ncbi:MAG: hypothetical protein JXR03_01650 [Cyclobacteriaceae bacterium]